MEKETTSQWALTYVIPLTTMMGSVKDMLSPYKIDVNECGFQRNTKLPIYIRIAYQRKTDMIILYIYKRY